MNSAFLSAKFALGLPYAEYVQTGNPEQQRRWHQCYDAVQVTTEQRQHLSRFTRSMKILVVSGVWCGDCIEQIPLVQRLTESNPERISLRLIDRDAHKDLSSQLRINGGDRVPVVLFLAEDDELCAIFGDRTLSRYRALAARQIGPSCSLGTVLPPKEELAAGVQDWLNELERIQIMLRLSGRLRQKHGD
jgi:thiol-disulfide isomerase/thioredoxin